MKLSDKLIFLGEIPQTVGFEKRKVIGAFKKETWQEDKVVEDTALVYQSKKGLFIITGCSHSGICNMIEYAKKVCGEEKIYGVIGGFHLLKKDERLEQTVSYLAKLGLEKLYPCHCVCFQAKARMNEAMPVEEVGVGLTIEIE